MDESTIINAIQSHLTEKGFSTDGNQFLIGREAMARILFKAGVLTDRISCRALTVLIKTAVKDRNTLRDYRTNQMRGWLFFGENSSVVIGEKMTVIE